MQGTPAVSFMVSPGQDGEKSATGCLQLNKQQQREDEGELRFLARGSFSSSSSFHSSEEEGTDHEGDLLDCSGSRPLLLDSEEEEEACKINIQHREREGVSPKDLPSPQNVQGKAFPGLPGKGAGERDIFATAPFQSFKTREDELDVFTKAPFLSKTQGFPKPLDEGDVFLKAPFTKRRSQEELMPCAFAKEPPPSVMGMPSSLLPRGPSYSETSFPQLSSAAPCAPRASRGRDAHSSKGASGEIGTIPNDHFQGRGLLGSKTSRPQSLTKYPQASSPGTSAQPMAAYKVVSQTNKQAIVGSISIASLSSRTQELPSSDPFASAPFPSKPGKQKP